MSREDEGFVARCLQVEVSSQGDTIESAIENLREALALYFEDTPPPSQSKLPVVRSLELTP